MAMSTKPILPKVYANIDENLVGIGLFPKIAPRNSNPLIFDYQFDEIGSYCEPHKPSRLENILNGKRVDASLLPYRLNPSISGSVSIEENLRDFDLSRFDERAKKCIAIFREQGFSLLDHHLKQLSLKREQLFNSEKQKFDSNAEIVLVVDQALDDPFALGAVASADQFTLMLKAARCDYPDALILLLPARDSAGQKAQGYCDLSVASSLDIHVLDKNYNTAQLVDLADYVYVVSSLLGFEALYFGKPVTCFGVSFYGGWGLTQDHEAISYVRRFTKVSVEELFAAVFFIYSHYINPVSGKPCEVEDALALLVLQKNCYIENSAVSICVGFPPWKRAYIKRMLYSPGVECHFVGNAKQAAGLITGLQKRQFFRQREDVLSARERIQLVQWGEVFKQEINVLAERFDLEKVCLEDGFVRSVGLGKYYIPPLSLVRDLAGIYYDATTASDLENILSTKEFSEPELVRASKLIEQLIQGKVSKYNVGEEMIPPRVARLIEDFRSDSKGGGANNSKFCEENTNREGSIALVVGQVGDDVSVRLGGVSIRSDLELIAEVRKNNPAAIIMYKPHPDVVSLNVAASDINVVQRAQAEAIADITVSDIDIQACLGIVDELHTISSLAGFEALIRGLKVFVYGRPFYAGWGLTVDRAGIERRGRRLTRQALVHAVLIDYPRYMDYQTGCFITVEQALGSIGKIKQQSDAAKTQAIPSSKLRRVYLKLRNLTGSLIYGLRD